MKKFWILDFRFWIAGLLIFSFHLSSFSLALAHPGRLDKDGCHHVLKDWKYKNGNVLKAGTYHCHRGLGAMKLDGSELIDDPNDVGEEVDECRERSVAKLKELLSFFGRVKGGDLLTKKEFQRQENEIAKALLSCSEDKR